MAGRVELGQSLCGSVRVKKFGPMSNCVVSYLGVNLFHSADCNDCLCSASSSSLTVRRTRLSTVCDRIVPVADAPTRKSNGAMSRPPEFSMVARALIYSGILTLILK